MTTPSALYIDAAMTQVARKRKSNIYAMRDIFPAVGVRQRQGLIWLKDANHEELRPVGTERAPGAEAKPYATAPPTTTTYSAIDHALEGFVTDEERTEAESAVASEIATVERVVDKIDLEREIAGVAAILAAATAASQTGAPSTKWDVVATGDAVKDIKDQFETIQNATGVTPNALAIGDNVLRSISNTDIWKARVHDTVTPSSARELMGDARILAALLGIPEMNVSVTRSFYKSAGGYGGSPTRARIWGNNVLLYYKEPPSLSYTGYGLHIMWTGSTGAPRENGGFLTERERVAKRKGDAFYVHNYYDQVVTEGSAGYYFTAVLT